MAANTIPVLEKTVSVLNAIAQSTAGGVSAKSLSLSLNIAPATCYRILRTLCKHNWTRVSADGQYQVAYGLAALSSTYSEVEHLLQRLNYSLRALSDETGLSVKICLGEGVYAVTATRTESRRPNAITSPVGSKMHLALAGAAGAILLASLPTEQAEGILAAAPDECWSRYSLESFLNDVAEVKKHGISRALGKFHPSIYAIAVPLAFSPGNTAALAIVGWPEDFSGTKQAAVERKLKEHASRMQRIVDQHTAHPGIALDLTGSSGTSVEGAYRRNVL